MRYIKLYHSIWEHNLTASQLMVYVAIVKHSNFLSHCILKHTSIAKLVGLSSSTVLRSVKELEKKGLILVNNRYNQQGNRIANGYTIVTQRGSYTKIPHNIFYLQLNKSTFKVYLYLLKCSHSKTLLAIPSINTMATFLHMSKRTIVDEVAILHSRGFIFKSSYLRKSDGAWGHNRFLVLPLVLRVLWFQILLKFRKRSPKCSASAFAKCIALLFYSDVSPLSNLMPIICPNRCRKKSVFHMRI